MAALRPHGSWRLAALVVLGAAAFVGLFGYLGGFFDRTAGGSLEWHEFRWDAETMAYTAAMWVCWAAAMAMILLSRESTNTKLGGAVLISLPVGIFLLIFLGFVELGPR